MNGAAQVLAELTAHGLRVRAEGDRLALSPPSALTPEPRERALAHKRELLAMLASGPSVERGEPLSSGLAIREVLGFQAMLLRELPIPASLVLDVPGLSFHVTVGTHPGCARRSFGVHEWLAMVALAAAGFASPTAFRTWARGREREQLHAVTPPAHGCNTTVARVLAGFWLHAAGGRPRRTGAMSALERAREKQAQLRAIGVSERLDPIERARRNPRRLRAAVTAKCWECCGGGQDPGTRRAIAECTVRSCPLHAHRPYQPPDGER